MDYFFVLDMSIALMVRAFMNSFDQVSLDRSFPSSTLGSVSIPKGIGNLGSDIQILEFG